MAKQENQKTGGEERQKEARNLAREAADESKAGHKEEARFVLDEAKKLDPGAVKEALHEDHPKPAAKPGKP